MLEEHKETLLANEEFRRQQSKRRKENRGVNMSEEEYKRLNQSSLAPSKVLQWKKQTA